MNEMPSRTRNESNDAQVSTEREMHIAPNVAYDFEATHENTYDTCVRRHKME